MAVSETLKTATLKTSIFYTEVRGVGEAVTSMATVSSSSGPQLWLGSCDTT